MRWQATCSSKSPSLPPSLSWLAPRDASPVNTVESSWARAFALVFVFPITVLLRKLSVLLGSTVASLLTYGQFLCFQLVMVMEIPMHTIQHVIVGYLLLKVTLITTILVLAGTTERVTY